MAPKGRGGSNSLGGLPVERLITREELNAECGKFGTKLLRPIGAVLRMGGVSAGEVGDVVLVGASTRMTCVQAMLQVRAKSSGQEQA